MDYIHYKVSRLLHVYCLLLVSKILILRKFTLSSVSDDISFKISFMSYKAQITLL